MRSFAIAVVGCSPEPPERNNFHAQHGIWTMPQAKIITDAEFKRAIAIVATRRHVARDRLALLLTHWAGMRVCEVAALTWETVLGPSGEVLEEWRLDSDQTKGSKGRVVYANSKLRKELTAFLKAYPPADLSDPVLTSQKGTNRRQGFSANTLCQLINTIYRDAGIKGATSHSGRRGFITALANHSVGIKTIMELAGHRQLSTTQRYVEVTPEQKRKAVELV
jgi:integrase/recombinase XerD